MLFEYFAGAIFTPQEVFLFCTVAFLILGTVTGLAVFLGRKLTKKMAGQGGKSKLFQSLLIGFTVITAILLIFFVIPTKVKDARWERKQQECAKQVDYTSPADNNSDVATAESQSAYQRCLEL